jgi:hypothetical protein
MYPPMTNFSTLIDTVPAPEARSHPRLIDTICLLRHNTFEPVGFRRPKDRGAVSRPVFPESEPKHLASLLGASPEQLTQ